MLGLFAKTFFLTQNKRAVCTIFSQCVILKNNTSDVILAIKKQHAGRFAGMLSDDENLYSTFYKNVVGVIVNDQRYSWLGAIWNHFSGREPQLS